MIIQRAIVVMAIVASSIGALADDNTTATINAYPEVKAAVESLTDYFGERALKQPDGPTYEMFANVTPPMRYSTAAFRDYPVILSAPNGLRKARVISDGSAVNARAASKMWHDPGTPVTFFVGDDAGTTFGMDKRKVSFPKLANGCIPIVEFTYSHEGTTYTEESFVPVSEPYASRAAVMVRFSTEGKGGKVSAVLGGTVTPDGSTGYKQGEGFIYDAAGRGQVWYDENWQWDQQRSSLSVTVSPGTPVVLVVLTTPAFETPVYPDADVYDRERAKCIEAWEAILARGTQIEVPEALVNDAWRASVLGNFALIEGDDMNYSALNNYEKLYAGEGSDAVRSLLLFGQEQDAKRTLLPVLDYWRAELTNHQAALQLQMLAHYYWLTRDVEFIREQRPRWWREVQEIVDSRETETGLLPKERYAGDIPTMVHSLNVNANCWRGLRDMAAVMQECGYTTEAAPLAATAAEFRKVILDAVEKSVFRDVDPPFVPNGLFGAEKPTEKLTQGQFRAYYNLMAPYILGSEVFGPGAENETNIIHTFQKRGGLFMGMVRTHPKNPIFVAHEAVNNLYGLRLTQVQLRRDEVDRALVSFYGKLAHAMAPGTYYSGESSGVFPNDQFGRPFYLPPNSAANAFFIFMLRYNLVQDWDLNDDGKPETLRLLFATPRQWLRDGAEIKVERAPTAFGDLSIHATSNIAKSEVTVQLKLPERSRPEKTLLRLRLPSGHQVASASAAGNELTADKTGAVDITSLTGDVTVQFKTTANTANGAKTNP